MAPKKKGLSIEEKIAKVEEYFIEHPVPFTLKDLIALIPKAKGVIHQSIEECVELLVSEGRVQQCKIGVSTFIWRFQVDEEAQSKIQRRNLLDSIQKLETQITNLHVLLQARRQEIGDIERSKEIQENICNFRRKEALMEKELANYADRDPQIVERVRAARRTALEAANRWTDNIFLIEEFVCARMGIGKRQFREKARIPLTLSFLPTY
eukprot:Tbor_TRINITY_DN5255_c6_g1::TRINITY_DN5255_c6_g1_i1::g.16619::m.16619